MRILSTTILGTLLFASIAGAQVVPTSLSSNFNGTAIPTPRVIWFNAHLKYTGPVSSPVTLRFTAVYTEFSEDNNAIGVAPIDDAFQAGTPVNYRTFVTGGARGGGGSNFTGSNSGTASECVEEPVPVEATTWGLIKARLR